jgi:hypothetical protein
MKRYPMDTAPIKQLPPSERLRNFIRFFLNAELSMIQTEGGLFQALATLCKATGGGWVLEADRLTATVSDVDGRPPL